MLSMFYCMNKQAYISAHLWAYRSCCLYDCYWWWSLTYCPESVERWHMACMNCSKPMQQTFTVLTTGTPSFPCWSALELGSNLQLPCRFPAPTQTVTQVKTKIHYCGRIKYGYCSLECWNFEFGQIDSVLIHGLQFMISRCSVWQWN